MLCFPAGSSSSQNFDSAIIYSPLKCSILDFLVCFVYTKEDILINRLNLLEGKTSLFDFGSMLSCYLCQILTLPSECCSRK